MSCPINPYQDEAMQQYFQSLPPFVQENIMMCNPEVDNLEELRQCAEHLLSQNNQEEVFLRCPKKSRAIRAASVNC